VNEQAVVAAVEEEVRLAWKLAVAEEIRRAPLTAADPCRPPGARTRASPGSDRALLRGHPLREEFDEAERQEERLLPEDADEAFTAWAEARFGVEPEHLTELLDATAAEDWTELEDTPAVDAPSSPAWTTETPRNPPHHNTLRGGHAEPEPRPQATLVR
jgi:hypothetical protein